ncbi:MAG: outer membrane protein assembly factor BamA [Gammaproteobacteria bacterium]|nr:outer membrane protein assembly factor BamA [Gammaproteobacteria bacterium]
MFDYATDGEIMKKLIGLLLIILVSQFANVSWAQEAFVVRKIEFQGLQRISTQTVENYLPIHTGQRLQATQTAAVLRSLYKTGFFDRITLSRENNTLIIHVIERPTIGQLKITGNSVIPTDKLTAVMKTLDVAEGRIYNPVVLEKIKQSLLNQYYQLGRYNARVTITSTPMSRNRVLVKIDISEGLVAKIRRISIIGNHVFDEKTSINQLDITTTGIFTFFTQKDRYSEEKLDSSVEKLRNYYMDHGYLRFEVKSAQAQVTPDRKSVYITMVVSEGQAYAIESFDLAGQLILPRAELIKSIDLKPGEIFSRQKVMDSEKAITAKLGDKGYIFAAITLHPQVNDQTHKVILIFEVNPAKREYIRHVTFSDNTRTNDVVLRREVEQMEAAPASTALLENSKQRLSLLPFVKDVDMSVKPVAEKNDQVDVNYKVKEDNSAQASFKVGYSQLYGALIGAGLNQKNFLGTGNTFGINFNRSKLEQFYGIDYTNPYYTPDGISRSFSFSVSRVDPGSAANVDSSYTNNEYDFGVLYGIPVGQEAGIFNRVYAGVTYQNTLINLNSDSTSVSSQVSDFTQRHGRRFQEADFRLGYSRDSRDKAIFPTRGTLQTIFADGFAPISSGSLSFYTLNYHGKWYQPINDSFIVLTKANLGYGNGIHGIGDFPFFRYYYSGGIDSVRGYQGYTLGPRDSLGKALGGNMLADASAGLIFPNYISDSLRTTAFVDAGNVYSSLNNRNFGGYSTTSGAIRYSAGLEADWLTPFGPVELSLAKALNVRNGHSDIRGDDEEAFQFSLGANF